MEMKENAGKLLENFKGDNYIFGRNVLDRVGTAASSYGSRALLISNEKHWGPDCEKVIEILNNAGVELVGGGIVPNARPNAPREDVYRLESYILHYKPDVVITLGGGSAIDAAKAAIALAVLGGVYSPEIEKYFGVGLVSEAVKKTGVKMIPHIAIMTAASSGAHLTKYSNITDPVAGQKKLIVDDAVTPTDPVFDYDLTTSMPLSLTLDGAIDGIAHCLEVFYGATEENYDILAEIMETNLRLTLKYTPECVKDPENREAREAIGLATDLGGYAIMIGGTNGGHLTSFSLVDIASHGRACGIMNPYYSVFFAPAIEKQLRLVGGVLKEYGYIGRDLDNLTGRELGVAVAGGMISFSKSIQSPTTLSEIEGFSDAHIEKALNAAKNPQLKMKLQNMPIPLAADTVDEYMKPVLLAAKTGDFSIIKNYSI